MTIIYSHKRTKQSIFPGEHAPNTEYGQIAKLSVKVHFHNDCIYVEVAKGEPIEL